MPLQQTVEFLSLYGGPPLIGAFIGYLTNDIAIRMLFRPLRPWRIFGLRVPLTPGIIPSKRHQLAENIGAMVGDQLLTAQDIGAAISAERFQEQLRRMIEEQTADLLSRDVATLFELIPTDIRVHARIGLRLLRRQLRDGLTAWLGSPACAEAAAKAASVLFANPGGRRDAAGLKAALESWGSGLLAEPETAERLGLWFERLLTEAAAAGRLTGGLLPVGLRELIGAALAGQTPQLLGRAARLFAEPAVQERLIQTVRNALDRHLETLGPVGAMVKGFVNVEGMIAQWLAGREGDIAAWLRQPEIEEQAAQALRGQAEAFFARPLAGLLTEIGEERLRQLCQQTAVHLLAALRRQLEELSAQGQLTLDTLAQKLPGASRRRLRQEVGSGLRSFAGTEEVQRLAGRLISALMDQLSSRPAAFSGLFSAELRRSIVDHLVLAANRLLIRETASLTESLRIRELVRSKVDSLDLLRLERLLLSIMEEQFKYINLFGALLGFLIGLLNLLLLQAL